MDKQTLDALTLIEDSLINWLDTDDKERVRIVLRMIEIIHEEVGRCVVNIVKN